MSSQLNAGAGSYHLQGDLQPAPSTSGFVEAGGLRLHYLDYGTAGRPAMLCLHGGAAHGHWFDFVAAGFSANYHMRALDMRGHGDSAWADPPDYSYERYAADIAELAEKLDLRDFILIGHSMGGMTALIYAATHPGRLGKLVIVDSNLRITPDRIAAMNDFGTRQARSFATLEELVSRYRLQPSGATAAPASTIRHLASNSARRLGDGTWQHKFDRNVFARRKMVDSLSYWNHIHIPVMLIKGELSQRITPEILSDVRARCPHVEFAEVPHSYHHVTLDNPSGFTQAVQAFLAKHS